MKPHIGDRGPCPCCGKPAHYVSHDGQPGWYHDAVIDTLRCEASPALLAELEK
jgi:hypothetical protein